MWKWHSRSGESKKRPKKVWKNDLDYTLRLNSILSLKIQVIFLWLLWVPKYRILTKTEFKGQKIVFCLSVIFLHFQVHFLLCHFLFQCTFEETRLLCSILEAELTLFAYLFGLSFWAPAPMLASSEMVWQMVRMIIKCIQKYDMTTFSTYSNPFLQCPIWGQFS